jgi:hypothetical protein
MELRRRCVPIFRFDKAIGIARDIRARVAFKQIRSEIESKRQETEQAQSEMKKIRDELKRKRQELVQISEVQRSANAESSGYRNRKTRVRREILELERELRAAKDQRAGGVPTTRPAPRIAGETGTGALPDFVVIGGKKCGTTFLYHLLGQHPLVQPAASKELHFFDRYFDEGTEWYRRCFPKPRWEDGRRTITGEATPYIVNRRAPRRMARVVPEARLIALLRNPVERAYSDYQMVARKDREHKTFEEAIGLQEPAASESEGGTNLNNDSEYLSRSVYVDQLLRWSEHFSREQMLILKSEDFFERPVECLKVVLAFLDLAEWQPEASELQQRRHSGTY